MTKKQNKKKQPAAVLVHNRTQKYGYLRKLYHGITSWLPQIEQGINHQYYGYRIEGASR